LPLGGDAVLLQIPVLLAPQKIRREVPGGLGEPRGGIVRHAAIGPRLQGSHQGFLRHVLGELKAVGAEMRGEGGNQLRAFLAEEVLGDEG